MGRSERRAEITDHHILYRKNSAEETDIFQSPLESRNLSRNMHPDPNVFSQWRQRIRSNSITITVGMNRSIWHSSTTRQLRTKTSIQTRRRRSSWWTKDQPIWFCSVIHSLLTNPSTTARPRWSSGKIMNHRKSVPLFAQFQRICRSQLTVDDRMQHEWAELTPFNYSLTSNKQLSIQARPRCSVEDEPVAVTLFRYSLTFSAHLSLSSSWMIECNRNKPRS